MKSGGIIIISLWFCLSWDSIMFQWYNITVGACNRVPPIKSARVTGWPHLIHLKLYLEKSPGKMANLSSSDFIWIYNCWDISCVDSNIECFSTLWCNKFVNMDRGICVANKAVSTISLMKQCLLFSFNICWSKKLPLFAVSDNPSIFLINNDPAWK